MIEKKQKSDKIFATERTAYEIQKDNIMYEGDNLAQNEISSTKRQLMKKGYEEEKALTMSFNNMSSYCVSANIKVEQDQLDLSIFTNQEGASKRRKLFEIDDYEQGSTFRNINQRKDQYQQNDDDDLEEENITKQETSKRLMTQISIQGRNLKNMDIRQFGSFSQEAMSQEQRLSNKSEGEDTKRKEKFENNQANSQKNDQNEVEKKDDSGDDDSEDDKSNANSNSSSNDSDSVSKKKEKKKKKKKKEKDGTSENSETSVQQYMTGSQYKNSPFTERMMNKFELPGEEGKQKPLGFQTDYQSSLKSETENKKRKNFLNVLFFLTKFKRKMRSKINLKQYLSLKYWHFKLIGDQAHYMKNEEDEQSEHITKLFSKIQTFSPTSFVVVIWHLIILLILLIQLFFIPMKAGFMLHLQQGFWMYFLRILPTIAFSIEILLKFNTGYYEEGQIVLDRKKIISSYLKWKFWIDLTATSSILANQRYDSMWLDFIQFLHIQQMTNLIDFLDDHFQISQRFQTAFELVKLIFLIVVVAHFCGCAFHFLAQVEMQMGEVNTWLQAKLLVDETWQVRYLNSLYWAIITMNTVGYGDIVPNTSLERVFVSANTVICCGVFGYAINTIGSIVREIALKEAAYKQININLIENLINYQNGFFIGLECDFEDIINNKNKRQIKYDISMYMRNRNISRDVQLKVFKSLQYQNQQELEGTHKASQILEKVPNAVQNEVYMEFYGKILHQCKLFRFNFSEKFINALSLKMKESTLGPGEIIYKQGEKDSRIFFVLKGEVQKFVTQGINDDVEKRFSLTKIGVSTPYQDNNYVYHILIFINQKQAGSFFGHSEFFTNQSRQFSCQSTSTCNMVSLANKDVISIIKEFQKDYENFCKLRDGLLMYGNQIDQKCQSCYSFTHSLSECPLVHLSLDKDFILKKNNFYIVQKEREERRRQDNSFKTLLNNYDVRFQQRKIRIDIVMEQRPNYIENVEDCLYETDQEFLLKTPIIKFQYGEDGVDLDVLSEESEDDEMELDKDLEEVRSNIQSHLQNSLIPTNQCEYNPMNSLKSNSQVKNNTPIQYNNNSNSSATPNSKNFQAQQTDSSQLTKQPTIGNSNSSGRRLTKQLSFKQQQIKVVQQNREQSSSMQQQQQLQSSKSITSMTDIQLQPQTNQAVVNQSFSQQQITYQPYSQQNISNLNGINQNLNYLTTTPPIIPIAQTLAQNNSHIGGSGLVSFSANTSDKVSFGNHSRQQHNNLLNVDSNDVYQPSIVSKRSQQNKNISQDDNRSQVSTRSGKSGVKKQFERQELQHQDIPNKKELSNFSILGGINFDVRKDYENYFPHNNLSSILDKMKKKEEGKLLGTLNIALIAGNLQMRKMKQNNVNLKFMKSYSRILQSDRNSNKTSLSMQIIQPKESISNNNQPVPISPSKFKQKMFSDDIIQIDQ